MKNALVLLAFFSMNTPLSLSAYFDLEDTDCSKKKWCAAVAKKRLTKEKATFNLVSATKDGNPKKALAALRAGAHVNGDYRIIDASGTGSGNIPLTEACRMRAILCQDGSQSWKRAKKYLATITLLLEHGALVTIALLLEHGALVTAVDHQGQTAISYTFKKGQREVLALLLEHGAPYEEENERAIRDRFMDKTHLWHSFYSCLKALKPAVEEHIAQHNQYREKHLKDLLEAHQSSFKIKGFFKETSV